jgi:hypothetical protein
MPAEDNFDRVVRQVASDVLGMAEAQLHLDRSMSDLKAQQTDYQLIFERSAEQTGVDIAPIIESMPIYTVKAGDTTMSSLRMLGGVSASARSHLARLTVAQVDDTLASIAASLRTGRFVDSGRKKAPLHEPNTLKKFLFWLTVPWLLLLIALPVGVAAIEYVQCCQSQGEPIAYILARAWRGDGPILFGLPFASVILAVQLIPGLWALRQEARLRRDRRDL